MFCKNCGNNLEDDDRICPVCGQAVEPKTTSEAPVENNKSASEDNTSDAEDVKTPLFDFKWNVQDFPREENRKTEDIDFKWETPGNSSKEPPKERNSIIEKMKKAKDPEDFAKATLFSEDEMQEEPVTDDWYDPFTMKKNPDDETLFRFNKRNEEFQELLDKEFEKYSSAKKAAFSDGFENKSSSGPREEIETKPTLPNDATKKYHIDDFKHELEKFKEEKRQEVKLPEKDPPSSYDLDDSKSINVLSSESLNLHPKKVPDLKDEEKNNLTEENKENEKVPETKESTDDVAGLNLFDTSFISPFDGTKEDQDNKTESYDEPEESVKEPEFFRNESFAESTEDHLPETFEETPKTSEENISDEVPTDETSINEDEEKALEKRSIEEEDLLKELPTGDFSSFTGPQDIVSEEEQTMSKDTLPSQEDDDSGISSKNAEESENKEEKKDPLKETKEHKVIGPEIINEPVIFPFEMEDEEDESKNKKSESTLPSGTESVNEADKPNTEEAPETESLQTDDENIQEVSEINPETESSEEEKAEIIYPEDVQDKVTPKEKLPIKEESEEKPADEAAAIISEDNDIVKGETPPVVVLSTEDGDNTQVKEGGDETERSTEDSLDKDLPKDEKQEQGQIIKPPEKQIPYNIKYPNEDKKKSSSKLVKFLVAMIIVIVILLAAILIMRFLPNSIVGSTLNNLTGSILNTTSGQVSSDTKHIAPSTDLNAIIESQLSLNKNIGEVVYGEGIGYDESMSYTIEGANSSKPIENNFWKTSDGKDLLFEEQSVRTVIGFNSSWIGYLNDDNDEVFNYLAPDSDAEKVITKEKLPKGSDSIQYDKLAIGEIRQNGNRFYVWTQENLTIKTSDGTEKKSKINQLYELETGADSLLIKTYITL